MMINERLQKFLKEAKIKLMLGGVLGAVTLGGGAATISYAQEDAKATEVEYNSDVNLEDKVEYNISLSGQLIEDEKYDIGIETSITKNLNAENYVYDMYKVDDLGSVVETICENASLDYVNGMVDAGKYYAVIKDKNTNEVYAQSPIVDTQSFQLGNGLGYPYQEELDDYFNGKLTLRDATKLGGANSFLYDGIARGISIEFGLDFEQVRDTIINLNMDIICVDPMQIDILYPEGVNYTRLHENTDQILYKTTTDSQLELSKFAGEEVDFEVISELDQIYTKHCNTLSVTPFDSKELIKCFNFCFGRDEINGHKFEELSTCGKRLALVYYQRMKNLMSKTYNVCIENDIAMSDAYIKVYQAIEPVTMLSVAKNVGSEDLVKNFYYLNLESLKEEQTSFEYYTVKPGDVLWKIALDNGMLPQEFYDLNRDVIGDNPNLIFPGQKLKVNPTHDFESKTK